MKKIILYSATLFFAAHSFCQTINATSKEYYLKRSRTQKTIGFVMVGAGVALAIAGLATEEKNINNDPISAISNTGPAILIITGAGAALGSIPLFIASAKNKKKATEITLINQPILLPQQNSIALKMQPALSLKISL